jgi:hypothetical protein
MDYPDPGHVEEIKKELEERARQSREPREPDISQRLAKWLLVAFLASPFMLLALGNSASTDIEATVTATEHPALSYLGQYYNAIDTDHGTLDLRTEFNGQLQKGKRYIFTLENMSSDPIMYGVRGTVRSFRPAP